MARSDVDEQLLIRREETYLQALKERYELYLGMFFPRVDGVRTPVLHRRVSERDEYLLLLEAAHVAEAAAMGETEPTPQSIAFANNVDGAQERLVELEQKFGANNGG